MRGPRYGGPEPCKADPLSVGLLGWTGSRISSDCRGWEWAPGGQGWKQSFNEEAADSAIIVSEVPPAWSGASSLRLLKLHNEGCHLQAENPPRGLVSGLCPGNLSAPLRQQPGPSQRAQPVTSVSLDPCPSPFPPTSPLPSSGPHVDVSLPSHTLCLSSFGLPFLQTPRGKLDTWRG